MPTKTTAPAPNVEPATAAERKAGGPDAENPRVLAAARSPLLWELAATAAMRHFRLTNPQLKAARHIALSTRPADVAAASRRREASRRLRRVVNAEVKYTLVHRKLAEGTSFAAVASDYGISRMRACQLKQEFDALVADRGADKVEAVIREVERAARKTDN